MKNPNPLAPLRRKIDTLDAQILANINARLRLVAQVSAVKGRFDLPVYDPTREKKIFAELRRRNRGPLTDDAMRRIFGELFSISRNLVRPLRVAYLGPQWTFTAQAARQHFGSACTFVPAPGIQGIFSEVEDDRVDYGVTPVETSDGGVLTHTLDALLSSNLHIVAEESLHVRLALVSRSAQLRDIRDVYSHANGFSQSALWLARHLPHVRRHEVSSTSAAAQIASRRRRSAAICSELAAEAHDLNVLATRIESSRRNITRFLVLGKNISPKSGNDKTSVAFYLKDRVGALNRVLARFARGHINLTRIESRPAKIGPGRRPFDYVFFVDLLGHIEDAPVRKAMAEVRSECEEVRIFGSYPSNSPL